MSKIFNSDKQNTELNNLINNITDDERHEYELLSGNCGVFANSLDYFFNGDIVAVIGELEPEYYYHVLFEKDNKYYDANSIWTKEDMLQYYNNSAYTINDELEKFDIISISNDDAEKYTEPTMEIEFMNKFVLNKLKNLNIIYK